MKLGKRALEDNSNVASPKRHVFAHKHNGLGTITRNYMVKSVEHRLLVVAVPGTDDGWIIGTEW